MLGTLARRSTTCNTPTIPSTLSPIRWTCLPRQVPYTQGLLLQEHLIQSRLVAKKTLLSPPPSTSPEELSSLSRVATTDILLLLQHSPVYTTGKREKDPIQLEREKERLGKLGADYVATGRGGQTTYHGPGQLVGYPLIDLGASKLSTRCYVDKLETFLKNLVKSYNVPVHPLEHTGVFVTPTTKIASIGVQIRRRITMHGFSINLENQTKRWFDEIVACGLDGVESTSVEKELGEEIKVEGSIERSVRLFGEMYGREMSELKEGDEYESTRKLISDGLEGRLPEMKREMLGV